nr:transferase [Gammaproteobacteria bacterium]
MLGTGEIRRPLAGRSQSGRARPFIIEAQGERHLLFSHDSVQSSMRLDDPYALACEYTRRMMAFLLFVPEPREIVMIGLGGGSLAKFCYRHLPDARFIAVEIDADVIALRDEFHIPFDDERFRVVHGDGARYLAQRSEPIDVLLVDAFDAEGIAPSLASGGFYRHAAAKLSADGIFVMNFSGEPSRYDAHLKLIHDAFGIGTVMASVMSGQNDILFAFKTPPRVQRSVLDQRAVALGAQHGLDFLSYLRWLRIADEEGIIAA